MQEYARSGLLDRLIVVEKEILEQMIGDVPLSVYEKTAAQFLAYKLGMIYFFENSDKVMSGLSERPAACRIATLCLSNLEEPGQNIFFYKDFTPRLVEVYYGVSEEHLDTDPSLVRMITDHKKQHVSSYAEEPALSYGIVSMVTETPQVLGICYVSDPLSF